MKIVLIGGSGHVGTYLVPRLVSAGHDVTVITRGMRKPYRPHGAWERAKTVVADRSAPDFEARVAELGPDAVIDMICFTEEEARRLVEAVRGRVRHLLHCGTIWVYGPSGQVPTGEDAPRRPLGEYGRRKAAIEEYLLNQDDVPATVLHPGHISGPGWVPINPTGNLSPRVFQALADDAELALPHLGMETLQHVHADDVAQAFQAALAQRGVAAGESFNVVAATSMTLRGYAEAVAEWFGREARLRFLPWEEWSSTVPEEAARITWEHLAHSPHCSIDKARRLLGYRPRYTSLETTAEAVDWLVADGQITVGY